MKKPYLFLCVCVCWNDGHKDRFEFVVVENKKKTMLRAHWIIWLQSKNFLFFFHLFILGPTLFFVDVDEEDQINEQQQQQHG